MTPCAPLACPTSHDFHLTVLAAQSRWALVALRREHESAKYPRRDECGIKCTVYNIQETQKIRSLGRRKRTVVQG